MSDPPVVPRPAAAGDGSALAERVRALRGDARVGIAVLVCVSVAAGVAWFRAGIAPASPAAKPARGSASTVDTTTTAPAITTTTVGEILVDVVGAVRVTGVVTLPASARVLDAIRAAGGPTAGADLERLNLAAKLGDGARVAVPLVGQPPPAIDPGAVSGAADPSTRRVDRRQRRSERADQRQHRVGGAARGSARHRPDARGGDRRGAGAERTVPQSR